MVAFLIWRDTPAGTVNNLVKSENEAKLTAILTYHVVPGKISAEALAADIRIQLKKNQPLFLPRPVRKYGFCSLGSLSDLIAEGVASVYLVLLRWSIDFEEGRPTLAPRFS
jgi:fasciclin domain-containing protein